MKTQLAYFEHSSIKIGVNKVEDALKDGCPDAP